MIIPYDEYEIFGPVRLAYSQSESYSSTPAYRLRLRNEARDSTVEMPRKFKAPVRLIQVALITMASAPLARGTEIIE